MVIGAYCQRLAAYILEFADVALPQREVDKQRKLLIVHVASTRVKFLQLRRVVQRSCVRWQASESTKVSLITQVGESYTAKGQQHVTLFERSRERIGCGVAGKCRDRGAMPGRPTLL